MFRFTSARYRFIKVGGVHLHKASHLRRVDRLSGEPALNGRDATRENGAENGELTQIYSYNR